MKKIMMFVSTLMMAATMNAMSISNEKNDSINEINTPDTTYINNTTKTSAFTKAMLNVPARVRFIEGNDYEVNVLSEDNFIMDHISCDVKDGTLTVNFKDTYSKENYIDVPVVITVVTPEMPVVKTNKDYTLAMR